MTGRLLTAAVVLASLAPISGHSADTTKKQYALQERCEKQADAKFAKEYENYNTGASNGEIHYRSHYNRKLRKCFYLLTLKEGPSSQSGRTGWTNITLSVIGEDDVFGAVFQSGTDTTTGSGCSIGANHCRSMEEWDALVAPYMEE